MEIIINLLSTELETSVYYYTDVLGVFGIEHKSANSCTLFFNYNKKIVITLNNFEKGGKLCDFSLQVPNAKRLYDHIRKFDTNSIVLNAYKFEDGSAFTFLEAPPDNYFYAIDPFGNKIQFFDKYEERE